MAEYVVDEKWKVHDVRCKVYTKIKGKKKLLALKLDNLWKHDGRRKTLTIIPSVCSVGGYMNKDPIHIMKDCIQQPKRIQFLSKFAMFLKKEKKS